MSSSIAQMYEQRAVDFADRARALHARYERLAWLRLLVFLAGAGLVVLIWAMHWSAGLVAAIAFLLLFYRLVRWHQRLQDTAAHLERLAAVNTAERAALDYDYQHFPDGKEWMDATHPYTYDLDVFGPYSLYQFLCRAATELGRCLLADWLRLPANNETLAARQAAVEDMSRQLDWQHHFRAYGADLREREGQIARLERWLNEPNLVLGHPWRRRMLWLNPLIVAVGVVLWILYLPWYVFLLFLLPAGQLLRKTKEEVDRLHALTGRAADTLADYADLIRQAEAATFSAPRLRELQATFTEGEVTASRAIRRLAYRLGQLDVRYNFFVIFLEFSVLWDLQQAYRLDRWRATHGARLPAWFAALAELEALISLGNLRYNQPDWVQPSVHDQPKIVAEGLGHPLLHPDRRVTNELRMPTQGHIHLITGSNMAGKSTWLRTVGLNIVLAFAGAPVCARRLALPPLQVYTSMRTQDALHESTSGFYAELKRLKFIIEAVEDPRHTQGRPVFFLLDEILKGTNSRDRHVGARALIRQLIRQRGAGLIATHDLELADLEAESAGTVENWRMEVDIHDGELDFDYKLKRGVTESFNATILMRKMGIALEEGGQG